MRSVWVIFKRELAQYFVSPIAYLVAFAILVLISLSFNSDLEQRVLNAQRPSGTVALTAFAFFMVFFAPLLTMRLLAEEAREGTLELMFTLPVRDSEIVLGKFLGAWFYYTVILALTLVYPLIVLMLTTFSDALLHSEMDIGPVIAGYLGIWLFGGATLAVGLFFSALTENQIIAGFLSMATLFILWLGDLAGLLPSSTISTELARALRVISLQAHYSTSFVIGVIRLEDVAFYMGIMAVMLYATIQILESRRWR
ncbi:MAG: ABC transporter permease [Anaerolineae bacterium]|nr:ABC transporter permease [Anaerolineae bacterium]